MRRPVPFRAFTALALAVALLAATACGGGSAKPNLSTVAASSPTVAPTSAAKASTSPTVRPSVPAVPADVPRTGHNVRPGEQPPTYPLAALQKSQAGANAFAEFFMKTLDWAYATTNPSYMKHYYGPTCGLCSGIATGIAKTAASHLAYEGGRLTIASSASAKVGSVTAPADFCTSVVVNIGTTTVVDARGNIQNAQQALSAQSFKLCQKLAGNYWTTTYLVGTT